VLSTRPSGIILDLDGLIWTHGSVAHGTAQLIGVLRDVGVPFAILTNDCSTSMCARLDTLRAHSLDLDSPGILNPLSVFNATAHRLGIERIAYVGSLTAARDFAPDITVVEQGSADAVVIGDGFAHYDREQLEFAVETACGGLPVFALQRKAFWSDDGRPRPDVGFWVAGIEAVTATEAITVGKPSSGAYAHALSSIGIEDSSASNCWMVSDEYECDLEGAKAAGLRIAQIAANDVVPPGSVDFAFPSLGELAEAVRQGSQGDWHA
jgi:HAD superfamily hydrolase (TIGR01450 family)